MKLLMKIVLFPLVLVIDLLTWVMVGTISCTSIVFRIAGSLMAILAIAVLLTCSVPNGLILLAIAFLVSPMGLPLLAVNLLGSLQSIAASIRNI